MTYAEAKEQFMGIGYHATTFKLAAAITASTAAADVGKLLTSTDTGEVGVGSSGDAPAGILIKYESDNYGAIQDAGYAEITFVHDATLANEVTLDKYVQCNGAGLGALSATATKVRAIAVDATNHKAIVEIL